MEFPLAYTANSKSTNDEITFLGKPGGSQILFNVINVLKAVRISRTEGMTWTFHSKIYHMICWMCQSMSLSDV